MCRPAMVRRLRTKFDLYALSLAEPDEIVAAFGNDPEHFATLLRPHVETNVFSHDQYLVLAKLMTEETELGSRAAYLQSFQQRQPFKMKGAAWRPMHLLVESGEKGLRLAMQLQMALGKIVFAAT